MKKIGNIFEMAENRLIKEKIERKIPCYTASDVIEYAIFIRRWLDNNPKKVKQVMKLTPKELKRNHQESNRRYYLKKVNKNEKN